MATSVKRQYGSIGRWGLVVALAAGLIVGLRPAPASAHCDSTSGPVVGAARESLATGDPTAVLAYVQPGAEAELTAAFQQTLEVRKLGGQAQELADRYFFETAVRLHRVGEGADYTGLKDLTDIGPALEAAEAALEHGDLGALNAVIEGAVRTGLEERYHAVVEARDRAASEGTVAAARERAEAELMFEKYVDALYQSALGQVAHGPEAAAAPTAEH
jgi:hypothetical protein